MNKNRIGGLRWRASGQVTAKPISIKLTGGRSSGCASKAVELTSGDLLPVSNSRLRGERSFLIRWQKSAVLSNIVLNELDQELERRGHRFTRYADDCNIYVRSRRAGERVMSSV